MTRPISINEPRPSGSGRGPRSLTVAGRQGFTLLEVLIAIALLMALVGAMFGFMYDMLSARERGLEHARQHDAASAVIRELDKDLVTCVIGDSAAGAGVRGDETSLRILARGVADSLASRGVDDPAVLGDLHATEIVWDEASGRIDLSRNAVKGASIESAGYPPLPGTIYKLRFRYHDGTEWLSSFDSLAQGRLPAAVEIAMWLDPLPGQEEAELNEQTPGPEASMVGPAEEMEGFDERAFAFESDRDMSQPPPSRVRVIVVPDSDAEESSAEEDSDAPR